MSKRLLGSLFCLLGILGGRAAWAQRGASATATVGASIDVFAGGSSVDTDYYGKAYQAGYLFGADYTWYLHGLYVVPSVEMRASISPKGDTVGENVYSGGVKLEHRYGRFHPYGDFLAGAGYIHFVRPNAGGVLNDNSTVFTYGGGVDVDVTQHFAAKAEYQTTRWNTGGEVKFYPNAFSLGVVYRIPFGRRYKD